MTGQLKAVRMGVKMGAKSEARWGGRKVDYRSTGNRRNKHREAARDSAAKSESDVSMQFKSVTVSYE